MSNVRRLQFIGNQFLLNVPLSVTQSKNWQKGDYLTINFMGNNKIEVSKVADSATPRVEAILNAFRLEAAELNNTIMNHGASMSAGDYAAYTNRLSHVQAKIRRLTMKMMEPK